MNYYLAASVLVKILIFGLGIYTYFYQSPADAIVIFLSLCLAITIQLFLYRTKNTKAKELDLFISIIGAFDMIGFSFLFHHESVPYYDDLMHFIVPFALGMFLFHIVFCQKYFGNFKLPNIFVGIITFMAVATIAVLWEILEFGVDQYYHGAIVMQSGVFSTPLVDSMLDLIWGTLSGLLLAILGTLYLRKNE